jgi:hypothetical protein
MVAIEVAMAILMASGVDTPRPVSMAVTKGHHDHAATDSQQSRKEAGDQAQKCQLDNQAQFKGHVGRGV